MELNGKIWLDQSRLINLAFPNYVACAPRSYKGIMESLCKKNDSFCAGLNTSNTFKIQQVVFKGLFLMVCL